MKIQASIRLEKDRGAQMLAKISGLSDEHMRGFAHDVVVQARENIAGMEWEESTGNLSREIGDKQIGRSHYRIETTSGYASFLEFGTEFIKGKRPFLWPAYRAVKRKFLRMAKWV